MKQETPTVAVFVAPTQVGRVPATPFACLQTEAAPCTLRSGECLVASSSRGGFLRVSGVAFCHTFHPLVVKMSDLHVG